YVYTPAAVWNRTVYIGSYDGYFRACDAATGALRWKFSAPSAIHGAPTVINGIVYFSTCGSCGHNGSRGATRGANETFGLDARTGAAGSRRARPSPEARRRAAAAGTGSSRTGGGGRGRGGAAPRARSR